MAEGDSPTIARLRVRIAVREARESAGLTQAQVADGMEWSQSKVIRIENGDNTISINDLRGLLNLLGVRDKELIASLLADARIARKRQRAESVWWREPRFRELTSENLQRFIEYEAEASEIRSFAIYYLPGPLQSQAYAAALTGMWIGEGELDQAKVDALVEARRHRQATLLERIGSVMFYVVVDQSVLMRPIGGSAVFAGQLRLLIELSRRGLLGLRMLPFDLEVPIANNGSFDLVTVTTDRNNDEVMYRENGFLDEVVENRVETARHRRRFEQLWRVASNEGDTIAFIQKRIETLEATLSENQS